MIINKFNSISSKINNISDIIKDITSNQNTNDLNCSDILKYISELDNYIIKPIYESRTLDIILFELLSGNIIRKD